MRLIFKSVFFVVCATFVYAQDVDTVINRHLQAIGGKKRWKSLHSLYFRLRATRDVVKSGGVVGGASAASQIIYVRHNIGKQRITKTARRFNKTLFTRQGGWTSYLNDTLKMVAMDKAKWLGNKGSLNLEHEFIDYAQKGLRLRLRKRPQRINNVKCFVIDGVTRSGSKRIFYIRQSDYMLVGRAELPSKKQSNQGATIFEVVYDDFRFVQGYCFPFTHYINGGKLTVKVEDWQPNVSIDNVRFQVP